MSYRKIPDGEDALVTEMFRAGVTLAKIGTAIGITRSGVAQRCHKLGLKKVLGLQALSKSGARNRKYREQFPQKRAAHKKVERALIAGLLTKTNCEKCGSDRFVHAHHHDYSKPLAVEWLCAKCHSHMHPHHAAVGSSRP